MIYSEKRESSLEFNFLKVYAWLWMKKGRNKAFIHSDRNSMKCIKELRKPAIHDRCFELMTLWDSKWWRLCRICSIIMKTYGDKIIGEQLHSQHTESVGSQQQRRKKTTRITNVRVIKVSHKFRLYYRFSVSCVILIFILFLISKTFVVSSFLMLPKIEKKQETN